MCKRSVPVTALFMYLKLLHLVSQYHHSHIGRLVRTWEKGHSMPLVWGATLTLCVCVWVSFYL